MTPCTGLHYLFESTDPTDHQEAAAICATCPVIAWCRANTPPATDFPVGTWAGRLFRMGTHRAILATDMPVPCKACGTEFPAGPSRGRKTYCSDACRVAGRRAGQRDYYRRRVA
jgi:hypothetical protein